MACGEAERSLGVALTSHVARGKLLTMLVFPPGKWGKGDYYKNTVG